MPSKFQYVLDGISKLTNAEKEDLLRVLRQKLERKIALDESSLAKSLDVSMGPVATGCPCCGK